MATLYLTFFFGLYYRHSVAKMHRILRCIWIYVGSSTQRHPDLLDFGNGTRERKKVVCRQHSLQQKAETGQKYKSDNFIYKYGLWRLTTMSTTILQQFS